MERYRAHLRTKEPEPSGAEVPQVADPLRRVESGVGSSAGEGGASLQGGGAIICMSGKLGPSLSP